ncbi:MAG: DUF190 domain-containing protein [Candidatus Acidiferrum sp.]
MLKVGPAKKVIIYVGEDHQYHGHSLYTAILDYLFYHQVSGANVVRGWRDSARTITCTARAFCA